MSADSVPTILPETFNPYRIMGTGSRSLVVNPRRLEVFERLESHVIELCTELEVLGFEPRIVSGMAEGFDEALAVVAINHNIPLDIYLPNEGYGAYYWGRKSLTGENRMDRFDRLCSRGTVFYTAHTLYVNGRHSNFVRNDAMVEVADHALVYDAGTPGTRDAVKTIQAKGIPMEVFPFKAI